MDGTVPTRELEERSLRARTYGGLAPADNVGVAADAQRAEQADVENFGRDAAAEPVAPQISAGTDRSEAQVSQSPSAVREASMHAQTCERNQVSEAVRNAAAQLVAVEVTEKNGGR